MNCRSLPELFHLVPDKFLHPALSAIVSSGPKMAHLYGVAPGIKSKPELPWVLIRLYTHRSGTEWTLPKKSMTVEPVTVHTREGLRHLMEMERDRYLSLYIYLFYSENPKSKDHKERKIFYTMKMSFLVDRNLRKMNPYLKVKWVLHQFYT